ncbi:hypothetical protein ACJX0J_012678, partial [Zea mays]
AARSSVQTRHALQAARRPGVEFQAARSSGPAISPSASQPHHVEASSGSSVSAYDKPWDICSHNEGNNSDGVDWLEDKSGGDVGKNKSDYTE